jgi:endonuclease G, mitochondrial
MARKRSRSSSTSGALPDLLKSVISWLIRSRWGRRAILAFNALILLVAGGWYVAQPAERKTEIHMLVGNYMGREKQVNLSELAWDIWQYYYGDQFVASDFKGGEEPIYGGVPDSSKLGGKVRLLKNTGYAVGYSDSLKNPVWVAYRLFDQTESKQAGERPDGFDTDDRTFAKVRSADYTGSGYDRGHLAPNYGIALCYGREAQEETFLMSNIIPQKHELNAGPWKALEMRAAVNYPARYQEIWVIAGPVFGAKPGTTKGGVPIPDLSYKIMVDETGGQLRVQAFLMPQEVPSGSRPDAYLTSVDEIEKLTSIDFLPALEDSTEAALEARIAKSIW